MAIDNDAQTAPSSATKKSARSRPKSPQVEVSVDLDRIENAIRRESRHCMVAEAIKAALPQANNVTVDLQSIRYTDPVKRLRYIYFTPRICQLAIVHFDQGKKPEPFTFSLKRPYQITRGPDKRPDRRPREKTERNAAQRADYAANKKIRADRVDQPFKPPAEYAQRVVAAMDDPNVRLGPMVALDVPRGGGGNYGHTPVFVGGKAPRYPGNANMQRTRKFGLKEMIE